MAEYPTTGSTLNSNISTGLSTQIVIKVGSVTVGAVQQLQVRQRRGLERVKEIGLDGVLEIVPNKATEYEVQVRRIVFDRLRLPEAFGRGFVNIKSQLVSFDIQIIDRTSGDAEGSVMHTLVNCRFSDYSPTYQADNFIISEDATIWCEDIKSTLGTSATNVAEGGNRGIPVQKVDAERETDIGGRRGTMDVSNMYNIIKTAMEE